jgi:hypothetical protein
MAASLETSPRDPRWYFVPLRVLLVTFCFTLLSFAITLLLGICGVTIAAKLDGIHPDLRIAYRQIALPVATVVFAVALLSATFVELRHYHRAKTLNRIERQMRRAS